jgi:hypothetical protein
MKKIILLSMITSGMLLASTINGLTTTTTNTIGPNNSAITNSDVSQGHTIVSGDSTINQLTIKQKANLIDGSTITNSTVNQGLTHINNGKVLGGSKLNSKSEMTNSNVKKSTVNQATTIVNGDAKLIGTKLISINKMIGTDVLNESNVSQSTLELNSEAELRQSTLKATNTIGLGSDIYASRVHQARVRIGGGYIVTNLHMTEINNLTANVKGGSSVIQGGLDVCSHEGDASDWCEKPVDSENP